MIASLSLAGALSLVRNVGTTVEETSVTEAGVAVSWVAIAGEDVGRAEKIKGDLSSKK